MDDDFSDDDDAEDITRTPFDVLGVTESFQSITLEQLSNLRTNDR